MAGCRPGSGSSAVFQFKGGPQGGNANAGGDMRVSRCPIYRIRSWRLALTATDRCPRYESVPVAG